MGKPKLWNISTDISVISQRLIVERNGQKVGTQNPTVHNTTFDRFFEFDLKPFLTDSLSLI